MNIRMAVLAASLVPAGLYAVEYPGASTFGYMNLAALPELSVAAIERKEVSRPAEERQAFARTQILKQILEGYLGKVETTTKKETRRMSGPWDSVAGYDRRLSVGFERSITRTIDAQVYVGHRLQDRRPLLIVTMTEGTEAFYQAEYADLLKRHEFLKGTVEGRRLILETTDKQTVEQFESLRADFASRLIEAAHASPVVDAAVVKLRIWGNSTVLLANERSLPLLNGNDEERLSTEMKDKK